MRLGEILALQWDAVYLHGQTPSITVKCSYCAMSKQIRETTKGSRVRYIGINMVLKAALQEAYANRCVENEFVIRNTVDNILDRKNFTMRFFKRDCDEAGVTSIRFHDLRHSFASLYMMNGGNIYDLQKILGHRDVQTTMRYAHLAKDYILNKANVVVIGQKDNVVSVNFGKPALSVS